MAIDNKSGKAIVDDEVPSGFTERVGREKGDGWLIKNEGTVVHGRLLGRFQMKQKNDDGDYRVYYQVKLMTSCKAMWQDPEDKEKKEERQLPVGAILNIDEHTALEDLGPRTRDGGIYDVWWKYVNKSKLPGGGNRTFWNLKGPLLKVIKAPTRHPDPVPSAGPGGEKRGSNVEGDDIPF